MLRYFRALQDLSRHGVPWLQYQQLAALGTKSAANSQPTLAQPQPLSQAVAQLEELVTDARLPKDVLASNQTSLQTLKTFLEGLANKRAYPKAAIKNVQFAVRRGQQVQRVRCQLKTTGGDCSRLVANSLGDLLGRVGLNPDIYFDGEEFQPVLDQEPPTPEEVAAVRAKAAAAGFPSQTITEEEFKELEAKQQSKREEKAEAAGEADDWQDKLRRVDPLFAAVAAVPWIPQEEERRNYVQTKVLDELEASGWDIRGAAHRLWRGERELRQLTVGKDAGSQAAIQALLYHAKQFDKQYGPKTLQDVTP